LNNKPLSASSLATYDDCPARWNYERNLKPQVPRPYFFVKGQAWHDTVRILLRGPANREFLPSNERPFWFKTAKSAAGGLAREFWTLIEKYERETGIDWGKTSDGATAYALKTMMQGGPLKTPFGPKVYGGYYQKLQSPPKIFEALKIVACERMFYAKLFDYDFVFKPDQIWQVQMNGQSKMVLIDMTTGFGEQIKHLQLLIYAFAWMEKARNDTAFAEEFGKGPDLIFIHNVAREVLTPFHIQPNDYDSLEQTVDGIVAGIQSADFHEKAGSQCKYCPFRGPRLCNKESTYGGSLAWNDTPSGTTINAAVRLMPQQIAARQQSFPGSRNWGKQVIQHFCGDHPGEEAVWNGKAYICPQYVNQ